MTNDGDRELLWAAVFCDMYGVVNTDTLWETLCENYDADFLGQESVKIQREINEQLKRMKEV